MIRVYGPFICSDKLDVRSDIPLSNSGLNKIDYRNKNLIDEPIKNIIFSNLDIIDEPKESLFDNIIVNNGFNCKSHIVQNTYDNNV